jgi:hypothetical protein
VTLRTLNWILAPEPLAVSEQVYWLIRDYYEAMCDKEGGSDFAHRYAVDH